MMSGSLMQKISLWLEQRDTIVKCLYDRLGKEIEQKGNAILQWKANLYAARKLYEQLDELFAPNVTEEQRARLLNGEGIIRLREAMDKAEAAIVELSADAERSALVVETKLFKDFLERHASQVRDEPELRDKFYEQAKNELRSLLIWTDENTDSNYEICIRALADAMDRAQDEGERRNE